MNPGMRRTEEEMEAGPVGFHSKAADWLKLLGAAVEVRKLLLLQLLVQRNP